MARIDRRPPPLTRTQDPWSEAVAFLGLENLQKPSKVAVI
jgi:hypothetical protein